MQKTGLTLPQALAGCRRPTTPSREAIGEDIEARLRELLAAREAAG